MQNPGSPKIDFFVEVSEENSIRIIDTLSQFGFGKINLDKKDFLEPDQIIQFGNPPMRIDIITTISGLDFKTAWENRVEGRYGDVPCFFISKDNLIRNKKASGRRQDLADVELLERM